MPLAGATIPLAGATMPLAGATMPLAGATIPLAGTAKRADRAAGGRPRGCLRPEWRRSGAAARLASA
jgi:hypothetical protein